MAIRVQQNDFNLADEMKSLTHGKHSIGAVTSFVGLVRDIHLGSIGQSMTLEHYPGMTEKMLARIDAEANAKWPLEASLIIHRFGRLEPGDQIVLTIAASRHRQAAFEACQFMMDYLKTEAPFWKLEKTDQSSNWVQPNKRP